MFHTNQNTIMANITLIRKELNGMNTSSLEEAKLYCNVTVEVNDMTDQQVVIVHDRAIDNEAEAYAAEKRSGHGIGCYCGYCCM